MQSIKPEPSPSQSQPAFFPVPPKDSSIARPTGSLVHDLPLLQVENLSSPSNPDHYRISPVTPVSKEDPNPTSIWDDWSGRGSHVDFAPKEKIPLEQGRFLGHGTMGGVYETQCKGVAVAWKRRYCRKRIGEAEMKEISILKKLSHGHIIRLVGTYTQPSARGQFLGLLLFPVAVCDLATFFEDFEAVYLSKGEAVDEDRSSRFEALGISVKSQEPKTSVDVFLYSKFGCLAKAIEYLHSQKIRHKDLKPSNILLGQGDSLWLTDFGSSTDFSLLSVSATDNGERGTPKYFAPEVAAYEPNGRAADIFSLGCIFLEILVLVYDSSLELLKALRPEKDGSFQANLHRAPEWFALADVYRAEDVHLMCDIEQMLARNPIARPTAADITKRLGYMNQFADDEYHMFGKCCEPLYITNEKHEEIVKPLQEQINLLKVEQRLAKLKQRLTQTELETALREIEHLKSKLVSPSHTGYTQTEELRMESSTDPNTLSPEMLEEQRFNDPQEIERGIEFGKRTNRRKEGKNRNSYIKALFNS